MTHKNRMARTQEQLQAESKTLLFEFHQMTESAELLRQNAFGGSGVTHNNTVQGFVTHFRNISCFFFEHHPRFPSPKEGDLAAGEYVADWSTRSPAPSTDVCDAKEAANKQIAHITAVRRDRNFVRGNEYRWQIDEIERELVAVLRQFLAVAPEAKFDLLALAELRALASKALPVSGKVNLGLRAARTGKTNACRTDARTTAPPPNFCAKTSP
jgi:hypothetical protein